MMRLKYVYAILSWGIVALGAVHMLATFRIFHTMNNSALWFFSGGITLVLAGSINLLHRTYGPIAPGLRKVCIGTNIFMTIFSVASGIITHAGIAGFTLVLGLLGGVTILSLGRRALIQPPAPIH